jgi:hypothetical protein
MSASAEMPCYRSHKKVWALKIKAFEFETRTITPEEPGYAPFSVDVQWLEANAMKQEVVGGYYVVYENGHKSWSPAEPFEKGHTQMSGPENVHLENYVAKPRELTVYENYVQAVRYAQQILKIDPVTATSYQALFDRAARATDEHSPIHQPAPTFTFDYTPLQRSLAYDMRDHLLTKGQL